MQKHAQLFIDYMNENEIKYTEQKDNVLKVAFNGENIDSISVFVFFDKEGAPMVQFKCWEIMNFKGNREKAVEICNTLNCEYRWITFCVDSDLDIIASIDAYLDANSCGKMCMDYVFRMISIIDEAYPKIAKARWA